MTLLFLGMSLVAAADESNTSKTVLGPRNVPLADGAEALQLGKPERGVRLTHEGLLIAEGRRERQAGLSNLCAGYLMLGKPETALGYCNTAIEENERNWRAYCNRALANLDLGRLAEAEADVTRGLELAPNSRNLKTVRGLVLDEISPVTPTITIDDRRDTERDEP
jgi:tetratricopeptide (TPR) repeat protein